MGSWITAIDYAEQFGNDVGATILASSTMFEMGGMLLVVGLMFLGISMTLICDKKYKAIIGSLFIITSLCAFLDMIFNVDALGMIGWMGMFLITFITGIITTVQKENQSEA